MSCCSTPTRSSRAAGSMRCCAAPRPIAAIGTITPFSNNAEICSFPRFCEDNAWPLDRDPAPDRAARSRMRRCRPIPTCRPASGFCMFVRRAVIDAIGTFDMAFGAGYGEENDFCLRAARAGWRNVLADDAFVVHTGGRSFAGRKAELGATQSRRGCSQRHPHYDEMVARYIAADPLRALREAAQTRLDAQRAAARRAARHPSPWRRHGDARARADRRVARPVAALSGGRRRRRWQVEEHRRRRQRRHVRRSRASRDERWRDFVGGLCGDVSRRPHPSAQHLRAAGRACSKRSMTAALPFGYTLHDLNFACPTITFLEPDGRYCGGVTDARTCQACLAAQPAFAGIDVDGVARAARRRSSSARRSSSRRRSGRRQCSSAISRAAT